MAEPGTDMSPGNGRENYFNNYSFLEIKTNSIFDENQILSYKILVIMSWLIAGIKGRMV
jgi:hypothetical protein